MAHGGKRTGSGRKKQDRPLDGDLARRVKTKIEAEKKWLRIIQVETQLMETTGKTAPLRTSLIYLDNRDLGNPRDTVNHLHDKPMEVNVTFSLSDRIRRARERAASLAK